jgi:hypothetical protein
MSDKQKWPKEPWSISEWSGSRVVGTDNETAFDDGSCDSEFTPKCEAETLFRIIQCVNACAGLIAPDAAIKAAREALEAIASGTFPQTRPGGAAQRSMNLAQMQDLATEALKLLTPTP